jgi:cellobiose phosphorylase
VHGKENEGEKVFLSGTISTVFRAFYNGIIGIKPEMRELRIKPCIPSSWKNASCTFHYRSSRFQLNISRAVNKQERILKLNGKELESSLIPTELCNKSSINVIELFI